MNFDLTPDQQLLQQSLQRVLEDHYGFEQRKNYVQEPAAWSALVWREFADLGLLALPFAPEDGGFGGGAVETMLVMECLGRVLSVEPFLSSVILCGNCINKGADQAQRSRWLPGLIDGGTTFAFAHVERGARYDLSHVSTTARRENDGWRINGHKEFVIHGDSADRLVVSARTSGAAGNRSGISLFVVDAAAATHRAYATQDGARSADFVFDNVFVADSDCIGHDGSAMDLIEAVGVMSRAHEITVEYMKVRKQFGTTIGSFQALQHRAVDMLVMIEQARSLSMYASMMSEHSDPVQRRQAVSAAKSYIGRAAQFVGEQAVQLHGGIGVTEECSIGHYYRRLTMIDLLFGDSTHHLAEVARAGALP